MQVMVASYEVSIQESALLYVAETYKTLYPELNKTALKEALDKGAEIPGVSIVTRSNMIIR